MNQKVTIQEVRAAKVWCHIIFCSENGDTLKVHVHKSDKFLTLSEAIKISAKEYPGCNFLGCKSLATPDKEGEQDLEQFLDFIASKKNFSNFAKLLAFSGFMFAKDLAMGRRSLEDEGSEGSSGSGKIQ